MKERILAGTLTEEHIHEKALLQGWVQRRRDLGGLIFIDLRDVSGLIQVVFNPEVSKKALAVADQVRSEYVVMIKGTIVKRDPNTVNDAMKTVTIEVVAHELKILNKAKTPPFVIEDQTGVSEEVRLKYRYLDLRRPSLQSTFKIRHEITQALRHFLNNHDFLEMETPILTKSTPEGARDYLVPSRVQEGKFFALPQSPQLFKQLLMMGGFEKYYQIARCFRDEDLRADRQPEFTQLDIETSFLSSDDIMSLTEQMMQHMMHAVKGVDVSIPFARMSYDEAMQRFGSDKPDTRFGMELIDVAHIVAHSEFNVFKQAVQSGGTVSLINVKGQATEFSRKNIDELTEYVKVYGAKGLAWLKVDQGERTGPIAKFLSDEEKINILQKAGATDGDLLLFVADQSKIIYDSLVALRLKLGKQLNLIDESKFNFLWVVDWPLFEYDEELERYVAAHHPFTMPQNDDIEKLTEYPQDVKAQAYDLVLNGYELGGGSLRIYDRDLQEKMFTQLGFTKEQMNEQFGFLLEALEYGAPPHGGIALGLDRIVMLLAEKTNLRDCILFPKTASAQDLLTHAPGDVDSKQLEALNIRITKQDHLAKDTDK